MSVESHVVADSICPRGIRLASLYVRVHRYVLAELNTHRVLSRNYRSSRAVPVARLLAEVRNSPAMPIQWLKNRPGMQATEPMDAEEEAMAKREWLAAARDAADHAEALAVGGLHKQWTNRGLEPYLYAHGLITSTEWENFFALRLHADAQPEMFALASAMRAALDSSMPTLLGVGEWHLPYVESGDYAQLGYLPRSEALPLLIKCSVARCARVSYRNHEGLVPSSEEDLKLYGRLVGSQPLHASPAEHQATPDAWDDRPWVDVHEVAQPGRWVNGDEHGNFVGWRQYRKMLPNENIRDR